MNRTPDPSRRAARVRNAAAGMVATLLLVSACAGGAGGAATPSAAPTDGVLHLGLLDDIGQPPDPDVYYSGNGLALTTNMYEGLVRYESGVDTPKIVGSLATRWEVSGDNRTYTFTLRDGVLFHDGTEFTSAAVKASFDRRLAVGAGPAYMVEDVAAVEAPDDLTVVVRLNKPNSAFLDYLASAYGPRMISPTVLRDQAGQDNAQTFLSTNSAGTGPYRLTVARVGERYEMQAFDGYWGKDPTFTTIDLPVFTDTSAMQLALNNGDLAAIIGAVPSASQASYVEDKVLKAYALPSFQVGVLYMNPNRPFMATPAARTAMFNAVDWRSIIDQVVAQKAELATGIYSRGAITDRSDTREIVHDPSALATYVGSLPPAARSVEIGHSSASADDAQIANIMAAQLQNLGLQATVRAYQTSQVFGSFAADPAKAPDIYIASGTWPDASNPYMYGHVFWDQDGGLNHLQCSDDETTSLLAEAVATGDTATYISAGKAITASGCTPAWAYVNDFVVTQPWLGQVEESHSIAAPYTLDFNNLTIAG